MNQAGAVSGSVRLWLRAEGLAVLVLAVFIFGRGGYSWVLFAVLFLAPDIGLAAYVLGARFGAAIYNALHSYAGPVFLAVTLLAAGEAPAIPLIWVAHIGLDRAIGFGLKYPTDFSLTHLGRMGRRNAPAPADEPRAG